MATRISRPLADAARQRRRSVDISNLGGCDMRNFLTLLALVIFASSLTAIGTEAQAGSCLKAPKDHLPCSAAQSKPRP